MPGKVVLMGPGVAATGRGGGVADAAALGDEEAVIEGEGDATLLVARSLDVACHSAIAQAAATSATTTTGNGTLERAA